MIIRYPNYLDPAGLPYLYQSIMREIAPHGQLGPYARAIAEYAVEKVDTEQMIALFIKITPQDWISDTARLYQETDYLTAMPIQPRQWLPGAIPMSNNPERRLVALACAFFSYRNKQFRNRYSQFFQQYFEKDNIEYYDFMGRVVGLDIERRVDNSISSLSRQKCHHYVFHKETWYDEIDINNVLLGHPTATIGFLLTKGYSIAERPAPGQVVIYYTATCVEHFGRVESIQSDGTIMVLSKFAWAHIYRHRADLVQFFYGNSMTFLDPPRRC